MIIYNVTIKVAASIAGDWQQWLMEEHIPSIMDTGCFTRYQAVQLLETDDSEGPTFAIQYYAPDMEHYERYINEFAAEFRQASMDRWGNGFIAFRSLMKVIA